MITMFLLEKRSRQSVVQTTVQLMVILGFHDGSHNSRISTKVVFSSPLRSRDHRTFCSQSCILSDRCTLQGSCLQNCRQTCRSLPLFPAHRGTRRIWDGAASTRKFVQNSPVHSSPQSSQPGAHSDIHDSGHLPSHV